MLRHLIQQSTGIITGSLYKDDKLFYAGFPGEFVSDGSAIVIKSHLPIIDSFTKYALVLYLLYKNHKTSKTII